MKEQIIEIMRKQYSYITFNESQLDAWLAENKNRSLTPGIAANYFADYLLANNECDVVE